MLDFKKAQAIVLEAAAAGPVEHRALSEALGYTLAEPIESREDIPPFANSAMDGYAVQAADVADVPVLLSIVEDIPAGVFPKKSIASGTCARIMTGAPLPEGADTVIPVEWTQEAGSDAVRIERSPEPGSHVRPAGQDMRKGMRAIEAGEVVTPAIVGMLATMGVARVPVRTPPRVAVVATGDELVDVAATPGPGQIRNANGPALAAQVQTSGGSALPPLYAPDDREHIRRVVETALEADVIVFSGGVSVGKYDYVKDVLDEMGMALIFWRVRQRPGKPLAFGRLRGKPVFGLPGNPVSSAMCFEQYVRPFLARMLGRREVVRPRHTARLDAPVRKVQGLHYFTRGQAYHDEKGCLRVRDTGPQASNIYSSVMKANCIIHLPESLEHPAEGTLVQIEWLHW